MDVITPAPAGAMMVASGSVDLTLPLIAIAASVIVGAIVMVITRR